MTHMAIAVNKARCVGCHTCALACKMSNNVPDNMLWNRVLTRGADVVDGAVGEYPNLSREYLTVSCQHCSNAPCERVCPTGATHYDELGRVQVDYDKCIGCRMCMAACPYNARTFNWGEPTRNAGGNYGHKDVPVRPKGVVEKCTLCKERMADGAEAPMCVAACPARARVYGDLDDPNSEISIIKKTRTVEILLEEKGTCPSVFYFE